MSVVALSPEKDKCKKCNADKVVRDRKVLEVHIDKGMKDGHKVTFHGESNQVCLCVLWIPGLVVRVTMMLGILPWPSL